MEEKKENVVPVNSQALTIDGKEYTFQFSRMGIVKMLDCGFDFEDVRQKKDFLMQIYRKLDILFMGALWKNHALTAKDCEPLVEKALDKYSLDELFFMFTGLYNTVFIVGGEKIPLAEKTKQDIMRAAESLKKMTPQKK